MIKKFLELGLARGHSLRAMNLDRLTMDPYDHTAAIAIQWLKAVE